MIAEQGVVVARTGEIVPAIDANHSTTAQIEQWIASVRSAVGDMTSIDELNMVDAMLTAVAKRLRQLNQDAAEAQRVRLLAFKRIGELLGPARPGNPTGNNQHTGGTLSMDNVPPVGASDRVRNHKARTIAEHWDEVERTVEAMPNPSVSAVLNLINRMTTVEGIAGRNNEAMPESGRRYPVIYADPPWRYDFSRSDSRMIENQYPTMSLDEISALTVPAADDAVLFMWATNPKLEEAFDVLNSWGFTYVTNMVWVKDKIGMGYYARSRHELLLIGKRGNLPVPLPANRPDSVLFGERGRHSEKPLLVYRLIESMYPEYPKIELFSRSPQDGWAAWGNQT